MSRPTSFPLAKIRHGGARVSTVIGHDPHDVNGTSPRYPANWHYAISPPVGKAGKDPEGLLWRYDRSWSGVVGRAILRVNAHTGDWIVYAAAPTFPDGTPRAEVKAGREETELEVAALLDRIGTVLTY